MRTSLLIAALPVLAAAADSPLGGYKAKLQNLLGNIGSMLPKPKEAAEAATETAAAAAAALKEAPAKVVVPKKIEELTLEGWKDTLYAPVGPDTTVPEEWWVLVTGGNKTCFGRCAAIDKAFAESALEFAKHDKSPHLGRLDCESQAVLCKSWFVSAGSIAAFEMLPPPSPIRVTYKTLNTTTTTTGQNITDLYYADDGRDGFIAYDGAFHPFDGALAKYGLAVPAGYVLWGITFIPSWAVIIFASFISRTMMSRRIATPRRPSPATAAAPRGAPPGDARS